MSLLSNFASGSQVKKYLRPFFVLSSIMSVISCFSFDCLTRDYFAVRAFLDIDLFFTTRGTSPSSSFSGTTAGLSFETSLYSDSF